MQLDAGRGHVTLFKSGFTLSQAMAGKSTSKYAFGSLNSMKQADILLHGDDDFTIKFNYTVQHFAI